MPEPTNASAEDVQTQVTELLADAANWPEDAGPQGQIERVDTHISVVFLGRTRVYKMKRALILSFLDYGTLERRRHFCEREIEINRRTAPSLYRRVVPVTCGADGALAIDGKGETVEWLVELARFDEATLFSRQAEAGTLTVDMVRAATDAVAAMHEAADRVVPGTDEAEATDHGGGAMDARVTAGELREGLSGFTEVLGRAEVADYLGALDDTVAAKAGLLNRRMAQGWVRECHGDLHLNNICMIDGRPAPFDAAEANDRFRLIDVLYDLAFLLMDLDHRDLRGHANAALNRYVARMSDARATLGGLSAMPLFLSLRAAIRCRIAAMTACNVEGEKAETQRETARRYLALAHGYLAPAAPVLVAVGGASGSGKTTIARALAPRIGAAPGAVVLRSDEIRKRLFGAPEDEKLPEAAYTDAWHERVYGEIALLARVALAAGHSCIFDAVHGSPDSRDRVAALARSAGVPFRGVWLDAPEAVLADRVAARSGDASDADAGVVAGQIGRGFGAISWPRVDARGESAAIAEAAREALDL